MLFTELREQRGQALVEVALVLPIVIMLLYGIFVFGYIYASQLNLNNAVREGARTAAVTVPDPDSGVTMEDVEDEIKDRITQNETMLDDDTLLADGRIVIQWFAEDDTEVSEPEPDGYVTVSATYPVKVEIPFVPFTKSFDIKSIVTMRTELRY